MSLKARVWGFESFGSLSLSDSISNKVPQANSLVLLLALCVLIQLIESPDTSMQLRVQIGMFPPILTVLNRDYNRICTIIPVKDC